jgi:hypothetical protein
MDLFAYDKDSDTYKLVHSSTHIVDLRIIGANLKRNFELIDKERNEEVDWFVIADNEDIVEFIDEDCCWKDYEGD